MLKAKQILLLTLLLLGVLLTREAQAFYNPSTGRWLSRDPIGELKGANLHNFVRNDPQDYYDIRGLCAAGTCGPDITAALDRTMGNVKSLFWKWDDGLACAACKQLYDFFGGKFTKAWDIKELYMMGTEGRNDPAPSPCARTVTYNGRCHYAGAANYELWGKANSLCHQRFGDVWNLSNAIVFDFAYFAYEGYPLNDEQWDKIGFTAHGYTGFGLFPGAKDCDPNRVPIKNYAFQWRWLPAKDWPPVKP